MPSRCWILGCPSNVDRSNTKFFKFPHHEGLKQLWVDAIKRDIAPTEFSRVCSKHFKSEDVIAIDSGGSTPSRFKLADGAVPCIFEGLVPRKPRKKSSPKSNISPEEAIDSESTDTEVMGRTCSVPGCKSNSKGASDYTTVFKFPSDLDRKQLWIQKINKENFKPSLSSVVCIKHFDESCIIREDIVTQDDGNEVIVPRLKFALTADAVPSIFEDLPSTPKKKRVMKKKKEISKTEENCTESELKKKTLVNDSSVNESINKTDEVSNNDSQDDEENETSLLDVINSSTIEMEMNIDKFPTTDKPIITVLKAQEVEKPISDEEEIIPLEQLKSPIIKSHMKKIPNDLPSPYKHLPAVSVCLKEEDRVILTQDENKSLKRSSSISSNSNSAAENVKSSPLPKRRKIEKPAPLVIGRQNDAYCWVCHRENIVLSCIACPRAYHLKCGGEISDQSDWVCLECRRILTAENVDTRSSVLSEISLDRLCALLRFCLNKMKHRAAVPFHNPVSLELYPMYLHYVIHPMDFSLLEKNIKQKLYGCTEAFLSDVKWILHNSCVFNGSQHALSSNARGLVKTCENDMQEIEICPDCFMHSVIRNKYWFADVCRKPHPLVWAKLKGFPYWPAKVVRILDGNVDARFFGAHDRAWVPINQCYHLSKETPTTSKPKKKGTYEAAIDELNVHVQLLIQKFGTFDYAAARTVFNPKNKKLMYHSIDIDKVDKEEIPFDPSAANSKEFCPSPTDDRRMSLDSKMDVDQCEEASSNSMVPAADTQISRMLSCDNEKEEFCKDKTESKVQESVAEKTENSKDIDLTLEDSSKATSNVPRDKLEEVLERIKGYVSLDAEEEKESGKEDEPEKSEPAKKTNISSEGTASILANLMKSKSLPKIDLPDIPAIEEDTSKEKESFLDMSKKNDTFTLHLLETIKKAKSRAAADDEEDDSDMETDEEDSDSDSVVDEENEDGKEAVEENESEEQEGEGKEVAETASASEEEGDDTESGSENESSSESSGTDIEEIVEGSSSVNKSAEKQSKSTEDDQSNHKGEVAVSSVNTKESDIVADTNNEAKSVANSPKGKHLDKSSEIKDSNAPSDKALDALMHVDNAAAVEDSELKELEDLELKELEDSELNLDETKNDDMEDDEVIICPPVKAPTPPLICLDDDGTETESENDSGKKVADTRDMLSIICTSSRPTGPSLSNEKPPHDAHETLSEKSGSSILIQPDQPVKKHSVVRFLKFNGNDISLSAEKSLEDSQRRVRPNSKRPRMPVSSSDDESSDDGLIVDRNTGVPLRGARRTFNNCKNRPTSTATSNGAAKSNQEVHEFTADSLESRSDSRKNSVDNSLAESSSVNEPRITLEQSMLSDGSNQENNTEKGPLDPKDEEIMRLKKKFATLFTAFRLQHWKNTQEKLELKHNMNLIIMEMRASLEADKKQAIETLSRTFERYKQKAIDEVKRNQWCAFCLKEARYQCCWNTNYCSINCQKRNFPIHKKSCTQLKNKPNSTVISDSTQATNEPKDNKKVYVVNMVPKNDAKSQVQIVPASSNVTVFSTSSANTVVPSTNVQYILAQPAVKATNDPKPTHEISNQEEKQAPMGITAISLSNKKSTETASSSHTGENKTDEPDLEEIYFPSPPQVCFEGLDSANADESIQINQTEASEKNSSDTEILGQEDKKGESSAEEDINFSDNDEADNEQVSIGNGVEIKAKFLNKCLIYGKTAKRLTRCLVDVLFPDLKQLATCSAFGQKSNVTKLTRAALPGKKVGAILEFVRTRFPTATRTEIVLAINMKCKEARNIVEKQDGEKPVKRNLFRRLLARDQSLEVSKTTSTTTINTSTSITVAASPIPSVMTKAPIMIMRQPPPNQSICIKTSQLTSPLTSDTSTSPTKIVNTPNILRCSPQVLIKPKFTHIVPNTEPRLPQKTIRALLPSPQPIGIAPREPKKYILPLEAYKQSISPQTSAGTNHRPYIIIGSPATSAPQTLSVTQPTSMPTTLPRK